MRPMKNVFSLLLFCFCWSAAAQQFEDTNAIEVNVLRGNVLPHSPELYHLITGHPEGVMIRFFEKNARQASLAIALQLSRLRWLFSV